MGYLNLIRENDQGFDTKITAAVNRYDINDIRVVDTASLYGRLRTIDARPDFDSPALLAERRRINREIHARKYARLVTGTIVHVPDGDSVMAGDAR